MAKSMHRKRREKGKCKLAYKLKQGVYTASNTFLGSTGSKEVEKGDFKGVVKQIKIIVH